MNFQRRLNQSNLAREFRVRQGLCLMLGLVLVGCVESRACTEEEVEAGDTDDCSVQVELVHYSASRADAVTLSEEWQEGMDLRLEGAVREVVIDRGARDDEVVITYRAEVELLEGRPTAFVEEVMGELVVRMQQRGESLVVDASHPGTTAALGALLEVSLPEAFDGDLVVQKGGMPGDVVVEFIGEANLLDIDMELPSANLLINDTGRLRRARLNVAGDIETAAFSGSRLEHVVINSEEGNIDTAFDVVPLSHARLVTGKLDGRRLKETGGGIELALPRSGNFTLATTADRGVRFSGTTNACTVDEVSRDVRLLTCGRGDVDDLLTFDVVSSDDVDVELR